MFGQNIVFLLPANKSRQVDKIIQNVRNGQRPLLARHNRAEHMSGVNHDARDRQRFGRKIDVGPAQRGKRLARHAQIQRQTGGKTKPRITAPEIRDQLLHLRVGQRGRTGGFPVRRGRVVFPDAFVALGYRGGLLRSAVFGFERKRMQELCAFLFGLFIAPAVNRAVDDRSVRLSAFPVPRLPAPIRMLVYPGSDSHLVPPLKT